MAIQLFFDGQGSELHGPVGREGFFIGLLVGILDVPEVTPGTVEEIVSGWSLSKTSVGDGCVIEVDWPAEVRCVVERVIGIESAINVPRAVGEQEIFGSSALAGLEENGRRSVLDYLQVLPPVSQLPELRLDPADVRFRLGGVGEDVGLISVPDVLFELGECSIPTFLRVRVLVAVLAPSRQVRLIVCPSLAFRCYVVYVQSSLCSRSFSSPHRWQVLSSRCLTSDRMVSHRRFGPS